MASSGTLHNRLDALHPAIEALMRLGGTPGLSLAVFNGDIDDDGDDAAVYYASFGVRDITSKLPVTSDTRFPACSLAKAVSAAAMSILIDEGKATWEMLAKDAVPSFSEAQDTVLTQSTTLADLFSHRSGMSSLGALVGGSENNVLVSTQADMLRAVTYDICGAAIEELAQMPVANFVDKRVFLPLRMKRSSMEPPDDHDSDDNTCSCYNVLDDGTSVCIPTPRVGANGVGAASGGLWTTTRDLVKLYRAMLRSYCGDQDTPFRDIAQTEEAHVAMPGNDTSYGLGWVRTRLPNRLGQIGLNGRLFPGDMPTVGNSLERNPLVVYHQGTLPGALACVVLLPETNQFVVVLSNALALTDVPDWVAHMVVEGLLGVPYEHRVDVMEYAQRSIKVNLGWYSGVQKELAEVAHKKPLSRSLDKYVGTYVDNTDIFRLVVTLEDGVHLSWAFQGLPSERYRLTHFDGDTFTWLHTRNELHDF
ncbi:hypothetical protein Sste5346_005116 [Sporothrix stenoceras]|uniref:Beta-lactamase-related domain-containing protein n=1 Tax=Sporothrix stenoceras TaxID=5173 RepID=A0ABR3Z5T7_9PEZI